MPSVLPYWRAAIGQITPGFCQYTAQGVGRTHEDVGDNLFTPIFAKGMPAPMGTFEKAQIGQ